MTVFACPAERPRAAEGMSAADLRSECRRLAGLEFEFIYHASFAEAKSGQEILQAISATGGGSDAEWKPGQALPAHLARMCEARLLQPAEERALFRRLNYCKYQADRLRRKLNPARPNADHIARVRGLVQQAELDRERIVRANLRLVISIAKKFTNRWLTFEDLLSDGISSMLRAVEKFDVDRGFRFSTYATQAIRRGFSRQVQQAQRNATRFVHGDAQLFADLRVEQNESSISEARWEELRSKLRRMIAKLDPRERSVIRRRFGLDDQADVQTLQSLADDLGVCKERVRQLEMRAMAKLRKFATRVRLSPPEE